VINIWFQVWALEIIHSIAAKEYPPVLENRMLYYTGNHIASKVKLLYNRTYYRSGGENMDGLTGIGAFFGGLGIFFIGIGVLWWISLYDKASKSKQKEKK